jgi:hypothetical protein
MKYKAGQWVADFDADDRWAVYSSDNGGVVASDMYVEDAKLIAKAPDMYVALMEVMGSYCLEVPSRNETASMKKIRTLVGDIIKSLEKP